VCENGSEPTWERPCARDPAGRNYLGRSDLKGSKQEMEMATGSQNRFRLAPAVRRRRPKPIEPREFFSCGVPSTKMNPAQVLTGTQICGSRFEIQFKSFQAHRTTVFITGFLPRGGTIERQIAEEPRLYAVQQFLETDRLHQKIIGRLNAFVGRNHIRTSGHQNKLPVL
jgi:hypothetical protein